MPSNIFLQILLVQLIITLTRQSISNEFTVVSTTPLSSDLQKLNQKISQLENRLEYTESLKENNKRLTALELQIVEMKTTLNSMNTQLTAIGQKLESRTFCNNSIGLKTTLPVNCKDVQKKGQTVSGMYLIQPEYSSQPFMVLCDMETRGGGWAYFLNRFDGSQEFYLNWTDYKKGFGSLSGEFWLGLESLHQLTGHEANELLVQLSDFDGKSVYALYNSFVVGDEEEGYPLKVLGTYSGDAGDSLRYQAGMKFTTQDRDQDLRAHANCASQEKGSWWHNACTNSNLCATYLKGDVPSHRWQIMYWETFRGSSYSLKEARMMVRPRSTYSTSVLPKK